MQCVENKMAAERTRDLTSGLMAVSTEPLELNMWIDTSTAPYAFMVQCLIS
jgi:hypothetical protein